MTELPCVLPHGHVKQACQTIRQDGVVAIDGAFDPEFLEGLNFECTQRWGAPSQETLDNDALRVGDERYMFTAELSGGFADRRVFANDATLPIIRALLGDDCVLNSFSVVIAYPGAGPQHVHIDHPQLFEDDEAMSMRLPPYAVTMIVPLVDLDARTGSTRLWAKETRRWGKKNKAIPSWWRRLLQHHAIQGPLGRTLLMDYRVAHCGTPNASNLPRPILYAVYSRPWFYDSANFWGPAVRIPESFVVEPEDIALLSRWAPPKARLDAKAAAIAPQR